ncbi:MAG: hypothetical protein Q4G04_01870 [bacterium]|nr:hypothetical protein [bacterium]
MENLRECIFFCDLHDTFFSNDGTAEETRINDIKVFVERLDVICEQLWINEMTFSFVSVENISVVEQAVKEIEPYLVGTKVVLGPQFSEKQCLVRDSITKSWETKDAIDGKIFQMYDFIKSNIAMVNDVFYADDSAIFQIMAHAFIKDKFSNINFVQLVPGGEGKVIAGENVYSSLNLGLDGLNMTLENYIKNLSFDEQHRHK